MGPAWAHWMLLGAPSMGAVGWGIGSRCRCADWEAEDEGPAATATQRQLHTASHASCRVWWFARMPLIACFTGNAFRNRM